jgi:hypothetical protein
VGYLVSQLAVNPHLLAKRIRGNTYQAANLIRKENLIKKPNKVYFTLVIMCKAERKHYVTSISDSTLKLDGSPLKYSFFYHP